MADEAKNESGNAAEPAGAAVPYVVMAIQEYEDTKGRRIREQVPVVGTFGPKDVRFLGYVSYQIGVPGGSVKADAMIPIPAANIEEAYSKFEELAKAKEPEVRQTVMRQMREQGKKVQIAHDMPGNNGNRLKLV